MENKTHRDPSNCLLHINTKHESITIADIMDSNFLLDFPQFKINDSKYD